MTKSTAATWLHWTFFSFSFFSQPCLTHHWPPQADEPSGRSAANPLSQSFPGWRLSGFVYCILFFYYILSIDARADNAALRHKSLFPLPKTQKASWSTGTEFLNGWMHLRERVSAQWRVHEMTRQNCSCVSIRYGLVGGSGNESWQFQGGKFGYNNNFEKVNYRGLQKLLTFTANRRWWKMKQMMKLKWNEN